MYSPVASLSLSLSTPLVLHGAHLRLVLQLTLRWIQQSLHSMLRPNVLDTSHSIARNSVPMATPPQSHELAHLIWPLSLFTLSEELRKGPGLRVWPLRAQPFSSSRDGSSMMPCMLPESKKAFEQPHLGAGGDRECMAQVNGLSPNQKTQRSVLATLCGRAVRGSPLTFLSLIFLPRNTGKLTTVLPVSPYLQAVSQMR